MEGQRKILNGTFEIALRVLAILTTCKKSMTVERISIYSYFALYLADYSQEEISIHPEIPYRNSSYINSKDVMMRALEMLMTKGLAECEFDSTSLKFKSTGLGLTVYEQINGSYKTKLVDSIKRANELMKGKTDRDLNDYVYNNMEKWGSEFQYESILKELGYAE